jgi:hypothetical protein
MKTVTDSQATLSAYSENFNLIGATKTAYRNNPNYCLLL